MLINGTVLTMDQARPTAEALYVAGDTIVAVGTVDEVLAAAGPDARVFDLDGATVLPGFIDSHSHRITQRSAWGFESVGDAVAEALAQGWTGIDELAVYPHDLGPLIEADAAGDLRLRLNVYLAVNSFSNDSFGDWYSAYEPGQQISPNLRVAGLKIFIDFDSGRTLFWTQDALNEFVAQRHAEGWQIAMKAIGQQSHELALNALEHALAGESNADHRHRLEHSLAVNDAQLERMARLQIVVGIQPSFPAVIWREEDIRRLADEQGRNNMFRWPEYLAAGVIAAASPLNGGQQNEDRRDRTHMSPMGLLYRSVSQDAGDGETPEPWMLTRALSVDQLLPMMTIIGAFADGNDDIRGSLTPGKLADLVVLSGDPLAVSTADLLGIDVLMTMVGGRIGWCAEAAGDLCAGLPPI